MRLTQDNIHSEFLRAGALQQARRWEEAAALWAEIAEAAPGSGESHVNLGVVLLELQRFETAEAALRRAVALRPDAGWSHLALGRLLEATGRLADAQAAYAAALGVAPDDPNVRFALGCLALRRGDYAAGWPLYEARCDIPSCNAPRLPLPNEWRGEDVAGKRLLIWPEQGFGDQIQFARFAPVLKAMGAEVTLAAPPELAALFQGLGVEVLERTASVTLPAPDLWALALSTAGRLGTTLETIPAEPYLAAPPDRRSKWAGFAPNGGVGVVWRGRPTHGNDARRSLPGPEALAPLAGAGARLVDLSDPLGDFADTAAVIEQLDLVVCVDTAVAHLAGALGKPCWILLPAFRTDWRWLVGRPDSPWYPSVRLFRQRLGQGWEEVVEDVAAAWRTQFGS